MLDYSKTVIEQITNSPRITALMDDFNDYIDPRSEYQTFYDSVMNIDTANGYGLDVWGRIVGVSRVVQIPITPLAFGFEEVGSYSAAGFSESISDGPGWFADLAPAITSPYSLPDIAYRVLILAKAAYNVSDGSIPAINRILLTLFPGRGNAYVIDNGGMALTYRFAFSLTDIEYAIVTQSGILPKPAGVAAQIVVG